MKKKRSRKISNAMVFLFACTLPFLFCFSVFLSEFFVTRNKNNNKLIMIIIKKEDRINKKTKLSEVFVSRALLLRTK